MHYDIATYVKSFGSNLQRVHLYVSHIDHFQLIDWLIHFI